MRIALITHSEASHTVEGKVGGWYDSALTENGKKQAIRLAAKLKAHNFDIDQSIVYSSDLKRAAQTAEIVTRHTNIIPVLDPRLREMSFSSHEGMSQEEHMKEMVPQSPTGDRLDHQICDGAETRRILATRVSEFINDVWTGKQDLILVTHGFAATFVIAAFQQIEISSMGFVNYKLNPGSLTILEEDDLFRNRTVRVLNG